jgi:hypothetical protein
MWELFQTMCGDHFFVSFDLESVAFTYGQRTLYKKTELRLSQSDSSELGGATHLPAPNDIADNGMPRFISLHPTSFCPILPHPSAP